MRVQIAFVSQTYRKQQSLAYYDCTINFQVSSVNSRVNYVSSPKNKIVFNNRDSAVTIRCFVAALVERVLSLRSIDVAYENNAVESTIVSDVSRTVGTLSLFVSLELKLTLQYSAPACATFQRDVLSLIQNSRSHERRASKVFDR